MERLLLCWSHAYCGAIPVDHVTPVFPELYSGWYETENSYHWLSI